MSDLLDAMRCYFARIPSPSYYNSLAGHFVLPKNPEAVKRVLSGEYVFPRTVLPDFGAFEREFGFPLPDDLKEFFSYYHPSFEGEHPRNPQPDSLHTHESLSDDDLRVLMDRMRHCIRCFPSFAHEIRYVPVGYVMVCSDFVWMERKTGRIFVEWNQHPDGSPFIDSEGHWTEGNVYPTPLSNSLAEFICELEPLID